MSQALFFLAILDFFLAGAIFFKARHTKANYAFIVFSIFTGILVFSNFYLRISEDIIFLRLSYGLGTIVAFLGLAWVNYFLEEKVSIVVSGTLGFITFCTFLVSVFSEQVIRSLVSIERFGYEIESGPLFPLVGLYLMVLISIIVFKLLRKRRIESEKNLILQLNLILGGVVIFAVFSFFSSFLIPLIFDSFRFVGLDNFGFSIFLVFIVYAILRYKLFDIKVIAVESLSFVIVTTFFMRTLLSNGSERVLNFTILISVSVFSVLLVRSVMKDIQDRFHIEQLSNDLVVANEQLRQMDRQKSDFVSIASHQLRTPLTAIKGYASLLLENSFGEIPDQVRGAVGKIFESSQRMVMIVENFLTVSRIERGKMFYKFEVLDLQKITKDMVNDMRPVADGYGLEIRFREDTTKEHLVRADIMKLKQIVHNLLDESVRHTPKGFVEVSLSFSQHADRILLSISDTGEGATPVKIKQMFERYEPDVHEGEIRKETGVELYIAREIVKAHRGKLWAESEGLGRGLTFFVELPALKANLA
jgi:signal transduction histidine kinase